MSNSHRNRIATLVGIANGTKSQKIPFKLRLSYEKGMKALSANDVIRQEMSEIDHY